VEFLCADFSSLEQVRNLADRVLTLLSNEADGKLDLLVNNAGLYSSAKKLTVDGFELTFAVNHLAPFLLTHLLLPALPALARCAGADYELSIALSCCPISRTPV